MQPIMRKTAGRGAAAVAGVLAAALALTVTVVLDVVSTHIPSLITAVAQKVARRTPGGLARQAIDTVGHADKPLLRAGTVVLALVMGALAGLLARRRPWVGDVVFVAFGLAGVAAAISLP